jgi:hypothetical protein
LGLGEGDAEGGLEVGFEGLGELGAIVVFGRSDGAVFGIKCPAVVAAEAELALPVGDGDDETVEGGIVHVEDAEDVVVGVLGGSGDGGGFAVLGQEALFDLGGEAGGGDLFKGFDGEGQFKVEVFDRYKL